MNKKIIFGLLCLVVLSLSSCASAGRLQAPPMEAEKSAWLVYWDWDRGAGEAQPNDALVAFAAGFDEQGRIALPAELTAARLARLPLERSYLSFVNDQKQGSKTVLKDMKLLKKLLTKKALRKQHVADIIALGKEYRFSGVEIDYENIWRDAALMKSYAEFVGELRDECRAQDLKLRVVLEPKTLRYAKLLPQDVEYVVMFYNLYGGHSGPGPKADRRFIWRTLSQAAKLPGTPNVAFANGGFDWTAPKKAKGITLAQAVALQKQYQAVPERDEGSRALHFTYKKGAEEHTVWYADDETLAYWEKLAQALGFKRISIWRLGGSEVAK